MDIFESTPRDKFYDILRNASPALVSNEIDKLLIQYVAISELLEHNNISQAEINSLIATQPDLIETGLNDLYIGIMGDILSQNE